MKKKTKSKVKTNTIKNKIGKKQILLGLLALIVVSFLGFMGYAKYKEHDLNAKAGGAQTIFSTRSAELDNTVYTVSACKVRTPYGYELQAFVRRSSLVYSPKLQVVTSGKNKNNNQHYSKSISISGYWGNNAWGRVYGGDNDWNVSFHLGYDYKHLTIQRREVKLDYIREC